MTKYYYAVGAIRKELDPDGDIIETCIFLGKNQEWIDTGLQNAVVYKNEHQALELASTVYGRVVQIHHEFIEQMDIDTV